MDFLLFVCVFVLFWVQLKLSDRMRQCELSLKELKAALTEKQAIKQRLDEQPPVTSLAGPPPALPEGPKAPELSKESTENILAPVEDALGPSWKTTILQEKVNPMLPEKLTKLKSVLKENWMGLVGSAAIVIGAVFFGLTSEIMKLPEARTGVMFAVSLFLLWISHRIRRVEQWALLSGWLNSIAGAVILFATIGAGGIEGLQFIHNPLYALIFLCLGISINLILAATTIFQTVASLHVILSLMSFCMIPQSFILLPMGAFVAIIGLVGAYRAKWDWHLLLIVLAFACQNTVWSHALEGELPPWMNYLAIACCVLVGSAAGLIHYSKKYQSPTLAAVPLLAHISNWILLVWNLWLHAQFLKWTPLMLGGVAIAGFILARIAKKRGIIWLFYTDAILAQLAAIAAIISLSMLSVSPLDVCLLILAEVVIFNVICLQQEEKVLLRFGYCLQFIGCFAALNAALYTIAASSNSEHFAVFLRMGSAAMASWGFYLYAIGRKWTIDDFRFAFFGERLKNPISMTAIFGTLFFLSVYLFGYQSLAIQGMVLSGVGIMGFWRKLREDQTWNLSFIISLIFIHVMNWSLLAMLLLKPSIPSIFSRADFLGLAILDALLIFGDYLQFKSWKKNIHHLLVYAIGVQIGLCTYVFTKGISLLIPGVAFLGFSLLALEMSRLVFRFLRSSDEVKQTIRESLVHVGLAFLAGFLCRFVTVNLQIDPIWHGISLRLTTEAFGLSAILYWVAFFPKCTECSRIANYAGKWLVEAFLGFLTLCVVAELPEVWRPLVWAIMAIGLLMGTLRVHWPQRLYLYSWLYLMASLVHVAFVTSSLTMPSLYFLERYHFPAISAIALQFCYAFIVYRQQHEIEGSMHSFPSRKGANFLLVLYRQSHLTILLPVFMCVALLFAFNFEKALLTLLWVGLTCIYLTVGLLIKSKNSIQIAMTALFLCSIRLIVFDLVQSNLSIRALVFIGVGTLMLGISILYKKYKHRIEVHEGV